MTAYHLIPVAFAVMCVAAVLSYSERAKAWPWFTWVVVGMGGLTSFLWATAAKWTPERRDVFTLSMMWDVCAIAAYNVIPLVLMGVRLSPLAWVGFGMVVVGAVLVKQG